MQIYKPMFHTSIPLSEQTRDKFWIDIKNRIIGQNQAQGEKHNVKALARE